MEPSSVTTTATRPGPSGTAARPSRGLRTTSRPSPRRPSGASAPISAEYTSKPSPRSNHRRPNSTAADRCTVPYASRNTATAAGSARAGNTSSNHANTASDTAAGQYPTPAGSRSTPRSASTGTVVVSHRCSSRSGLRTRHTGPNSSDAGTSPTQNVT